MSFLYATTFINRLIRTAVGVRIMCCSVTDSEWLAVLAHRGGDLGILCTWRASVSLPCTQVCISLLALDWNNSTAQGFGLKATSAEPWPALSANLTLQRHSCCSLLCRKYKPLLRVKEMEQSAHLSENLYLSAKCVPPLCDHFLSERLHGF